jgi:hypothetical protein
LLSCGCEVGCETIHYEENVQSTPVPLIVVDADPILYSGTSYTPHSPMDIDELATIDEDMDMEIFAIPACAPKELGRAERWERVTIDGADVIIPRFQMVLVDDATWFVRRYHVYPGMRHKIYSNLTELRDQLTAWLTDICESTIALDFVLEHAMNQARYQAPLILNGDYKALSEYSAKNSLIMEFYLWSKVKASDKRPGTYWKTAWAVAHLDQLVMEVWATSAQEPLYNNKRLTRPMYNAMSVAYDKKKRPYIRDAHVENLAKKLALTVGELSGQKEEISKEQKEEISKGKKQKRAKPDDGEEQDEGMEGVSKATWIPRGQYEALDVNSAVDTIHKRDIQIAEILSREADMRAALIKELDFDYKNEADLLKQTYSDKERSLRELLNTELKERVAERELLITVELNEQMEAGRKKMQTEMKKAMLDLKQLETLAEERRISLYTEKEQARTQLDEAKSKLNETTSKLAVCREKRNDEMAAFEQALMEVQNDDAEPEEQTEYQEEGKSSRLTRSNTKPKEDTAVKVKRDSEVPATIFLSVWKPVCEEKDMTQYLTQPSGFHFSQSGEGPAELSIIHLLEQFEKSLSTVMGALKDMSKKGETLKMIYSQYAQHFDLLNELALKFTNVWFCFPLKYSAFDRNTEQMCSNCGTEEGDWRGKHSSGSACSAVRCQLCVTLKLGMRGDKEVCNKHATADCPFSAPHTARFRELILRRYEFSLKGAKLGPSKNQLDNITDSFLSSLGN